MRIGLDIDNVITDFDRGILEGFLIEDKNKRNRGIINPKANHVTKGMFDWSEEEVKDFYAKYTESIAQDLHPRRNCKKIMDKLLEEGDELILISHRAAPDYQHPFETTEKWLSKNNIKYTKLILSESPDKTKECKEERVDVMIDDRVSQCLKMSSNGIQCFVMKTRYNSCYKHDLKILTSWNNLFEEIEKCKKKI